jgi:hypothetical protein
MNGTQDVASPKVVAQTNGSGAAAVLAAGIGCFALAVLALAADKSALLKSHLSLYKPTGPLSGVTTVAIVIWFLTWLLLELAWRNKTVAVDRICILALALLGLAMVLTFPPVVDLF